MIAAVLRAALDVVLPPACAGCGLPGAPCCAACLAGLTPLPHPRCARCGHPTGTPADGCPECPPAIAAAAAACAYAGSAPVLVRALKDGRRRDLAPLLARAVALRCARPPRGAVLVPVPLSPARMRARGFNQSALLAAALGGLWHLPVAADGLRRLHGGAAQRGASRTARARQVAGAFRAEGRAPAGECWLVDDVHTTGATLAACARALRRAGAERVGAVTFARTVRI